MHKLKKKVLQLKSKIILRIWIGNFKEYFAFITPLLELIANLCILSGYLWIKGLFHACQFTYLCLIPDDDPMERRKHVVGE
jgi:hypothetical protein